MAQTAISCEYLVIGGGTGGLRAALRLAKLGKTVLIEPGKLGGTCLNTGCIPTKAMLHAAHIYEQSKHSRVFGINNETRVNVSKVFKRVRSFIEQGQEHISVSMKNSNVTRIKAKAKFVGPKKVKAGSKTVSAKHVLICTGAKNFVPPIKGIHDVPFLDNEGIINLTKLPKSLIMIGGGYISMEFATFFTKLGVKVTVLERFPHILGVLDEDIRETLAEGFSDAKLITNCNILSVEKQGREVTVSYNDVRKESSPKRTISAEQLVVATGRVPNTRELDLDAAGINVEKRGGITVNQKCETSVKDVYACGDCTGKALFAHAAKREIELVIDNLTSKTKTKRTIDFDNVPWAVFTDPTAAGVGLSENSANRQKINYDVYKAPFKRAGRASIIGDTRGFVKVLTQKRTGKILGAQIVGPNADDLIHEYVTAMYFGASIRDIQEIIHVHPTLSEVNANLRKQ